MTKVKIVERVESLEEYSEEVKATLPNKLDKREIDNTPILGSNGLVTSDGIFKALDKKQDNLIIDYQLSNTSLNPIANSTVNTKFNEVYNKISVVENSLYTNRGMQLFTQSGVFIVPVGVKSVKVACIGGGGGGGWYHNRGGTGGTTSFGSFLFAYGGEGSDDNEVRGIGGSFRTTVGGIGFQGQNGAFYNEPDPRAYIWNSGKVLVDYYGQGGAGTISQYEDRSKGAAGGSIVAYVNNLTPGESINVIVGGGGYGAYQSGNPGMCFVEW